MCGSLLSKRDFQNNLSHNRAIPTKLPIAVGINSRLCVLKPPSGGLGVTLGRLVLGQVILEIFSNLLISIIKKAMTK